MSPPGGRRCPPALLALLLGLAGSRGFPECQNRAVTEGGSLCLVPEEPPGAWTEIRWKREINSGTFQKILTAPRDGAVSYPKGPSHGRATFQPGNLSLCISPVRGADSGVYRAEFESSGAISARCFRVSVWEPVRQPELKSQILERGRGWCRLALLCSSPGNVSYSWACTGESSGEIPGQILEETPKEISGQIPEETPKEIPGEILGETPKEIPGEIPGQIPGEIPGQILGQIPEETPKEIPGQILGETPKEIPGQIPEETPKEIPGQILEETPKEIPGQIPEETPKEIPGQIPEETPGVPSRLLRRLPEGAEPQICLCNVSNPAGWSAARAHLTCPEIPGNFSHWTPLAVGVAVGLTLLLVGCWWWRRRRRRKNSREGPPGTPPEQAMTVYATVGEKKPPQDPAGAGAATQEGATIYAVVTPRTLEHPKHQEEPGNFTIYSTVQFERRPSSTKRKRLDRSLVSTAYLEDHGGYRSLGFPNPAGLQRS